MKKIITVILSIILSICLFQVADAQTDMGFPEENYKRDIIKWNITPFVLWSRKNINLSYEHVLKPNRSFSINAGFFELPTAGIYDSLDIQSDVNDWGFTVSGDYRYYVTKRNPKSAPDGLYWGPFVSYHHYQFENSITFIDNPDIEGDLLLDGRYNVFSGGVQIGYQFIIKEKLSIDMVFLGPSLSVVSGSFNHHGQITSEEYEEYLDAIRDMLISNSRIINYLYREGLIDETGVTSSFGLGFRYLVQIGYRF